MIILIYMWLLQVCVYIIWFWMVLVQICPAKGRLHLGVQYVGMRGRLFFMVVVAVHVAAPFDAHTLVLSW